MVCFKHFLGSVWNFSNLYTFSRNQNNSKEKWFFYVNLMISVCKFFCAFFCFIFQMLNMRFFLQKVKRYLVGEIVKVICKERKRVNGGKKKKREMKDVNGKKDFFFFPWIKINVTICRRGKKRQWIECNFSFIFFYNNKKLMKKKQFLRIFYC